MCVRERARGAIFEELDSGRSAGIILQCYCTTCSAGGCRHTRSGIHPFMWKPLPCVSYQRDHPLRRDRDCEAAEGHSQPVELWRHSHILPLAVYKTPSTSSVTKSLGGRIFVHSVPTEIPCAAQTRLSMQD